MCCTHSAYFPIPADHFTFQVGVSDYSKITLQLPWESKFFPNTSQRYKPTKAPLTPVRSTGTHRRPSLPSAAIQAPAAVPGCGSGSEKPLAHGPGSDKQPWGLHLPTPRGTGCSAGPRGPTTRVWAGAPFAPTTGLGPLSARAPRPLQLRLHKQLIPAISSVTGATDGRGEPLWAMAN